MSLNNIKALKSERGFTIVELLIVVVIIGILAAIVIVAYNGVTNRAKSSKSAATASSIVKKLEAYNAEGVGPGYPTAYSTTIAASANSATSYYIPAGSYTLKTTAVAATDSETTFNITTCTAGNGGGLAVTVWDYAAGAKKDYFAGGCTSVTGGTLFSS